ncbi:MAG: PHB depolymerase family esterase [Candidatus Omnitrophota bacterium]
MTKYKIVAAFLLCGLLQNVPCVYSQDSLRENVREKIKQRIQERRGARSNAQTNDEKKSISVEGKIRTYLIHVPLQYRKVKAYPLVFVLHGGTANADNAMRMSQMNPKADQEGFVVVYPNGSGKLEDRLLGWNDGSKRLGEANSNIDDVAFFRQLIAQIEKDYNIDTKRIYVTGISNGAMMAYRLGCELSDKFAAIAPVSGALNYGQSFPVNPLSVIIFHGTADQYVPYNGGIGKASGGEERNDKSVAYAVDFWVKHDGCKLVPIKEEFGSIVKEQYSGGKADTEVVLYTIKDGGHCWPGGIEGIRYGNVDKPTQEISATDLIWDFFKKHPKL